MRTKSSKLYSAVEIIKTPINLLKSLRKKMSAVNAREKISAVSEQEKIEFIFGA